MIRFKKEPIKKPHILPKLLALLLLSIALVVGVNLITPNQEVITEARPSVDFNQKIKGAFSRSVRVTILKNGRPISIGSGVYYEKGFVITNYHVIKSALDNSNNKEIIVESFSLNGERINIYEAITSTTLKGADLALVYITDELGNELKKLKKPVIPKENLPRGTSVFTFSCEMGNNPSVYPVNMVDCQSQRCNVRILNESSEIGNNIKHLLVTVPRGSPGIYPGRSGGGFYARVTNKNTNEEEVMLVGICRTGTAPPGAPPPPDNSKDDGKVKIEIRPNDIPPGQEYAGACVPAEYIVPLIDKLNQESSISDNLEQRIRELEERVDEVLAPIGE